MCISTRTVCGIIGSFGLLLDFVLFEIAMEICVVNAMANALLLYAATKPSRACFVRALLVHIVSDIIMIPVIFVRILLNTGGGFIKNYVENNVNNVVKVLLGLITVTLVLVIMVISLLMKLYDYVVSVKLEEADTLACPSTTVDVEATPNDPEFEQ